jgi:hypothetical protein
VRFEDVSNNFRLAKFLAILMVVTGHFFGGFFAIPATVGLFVFAFSSGYFTAMKYPCPVPKKIFWRVKIIRLAYPVAVIDLFLLGLFLFQHEPGILTWQTVPSLLGLNGFLNWFHIDNPSPFGVGLWFFTLLLLFYAFYPLLARINKNPRRAVALLLAAMTSTVVLHYTMPVGYMLWMTAFAFLFGSYSGVYRFEFPPRYALAVLIASCAFMLLFKSVFNYTSLNFILILIGSLAIVEYLLNKKLPIAFPRPIALLSECVIQIYFIHAYLLVRTITNHPLVNFSLSMSIIIPVAVLLNVISKTIKQKTAQLS